MTVRFQACSLALLTLLVPTLAGACTCSWTGPLLTVGTRAELIVRAKVLAYHGKSRGVDLAMDVEVKEVLKGATRVQRIRIWGDNGSQCRPYVSGFPIQTEWIFAIDKLTNDEGRRGDYSINGCGEYWAKIDNGAVMGRLSSPQPPAAADKPERMTLSEFRERLRTGSTIR